MNTTAGILARVTVELAPPRVLVDGEDGAAASIPELRNVLSGMLYRRMHCGSDAAPMPVHVRNPRLERMLRERLVERAQTIRVPHTASVRTPDGELVAVLDGVRVRVDAAHWRPHDAESDEISLSRLRPMFSPGFFVIGTGDVPRPVRRVYVRGESSRDTIEVFERLVRLLDERGAYRAKMLTVESQYPRNDAIVVYLPDPSEELLTEIVATVVETGLVPDRTSPFAERIGPGVSTADDPVVDEGLSPRSFGEHRADAFARALVEAHRDGLDPLPHLTEVLRAAGIDPDRPSRNLAPRDVPSAPSTGGR